MNMKQTSSKRGAALVLVGALIGASLPTAVTAAENYLKATSSTQVFFVDGQKVELEAYAIEGHNYVKLRDIGRAVDFSVSYDPSTNSVMVNRGSPYQEEPQTATITQPIPDYTAQVNTAVFTGYLTKEVYNTIRQTLTTGQTTSFSSAVKGCLNLRWDDKDGIKRGEQEKQQINAVLAVLGSYPGYELVVSEDGGEYLCQVRYLELYDDAAENTRDFIASLAGLSDREKIKRIDWYVCDRIAYDKTCYVWPDEVLAQNGELRGACMSFAYSFQFLCRQAGIPCLLKHGGNHQWNTVYAEGRWWDVDASGDNCDGVVFSGAGAEAGQRPFDSTDDFREQFYVAADRVLCTEGPFPDEAPEITRFAQEVLVPGSSK